MKLLGTVMRYSRTGRLIVKGAYAPKGRESVCDPSGNVLGKVERVIGPELQPYVIIKPLQKMVTGRLSGVQLYIKGEVRGKCPRRRERQRR
ncbi:MAG TPA: hypothetical protein ENN76_02920 [Euryarchaeota archaeon]|nr:hypothetical protein [Euryarchaeota archaeon]